MINPLSGWPVKHELASVSVIADNTMQADALATALLVLGMDQAYQLAEQQHIAALFISCVPNSNDFVQISSSEFAHYLTS